MIEITRLEQTGKGTIGTLLIDGVATGLWTLELPWKDNEKNVSCIPTGTYQLVLEYSNKYKKDLFELKSVPNRTEIKVHVGNYLSDIKGCILVGSDIDFLEDGNRVVWKSSKAFDKFMALMGDRAMDTLLVRGV